MTDDRIHGLREEPITFTANWDARDGGLPSIWPEGEREMIVIAGRRLFGVDWYAERTTVRCVCTRIAFTTNDEGEETVSMEFAPVRARPDACGVVEAGGLRRRQAAAGSEVSVMDIYVVEQGCYSDRGVIGVYSSAERAMACHPITDKLKERYPDAAWQLENGSESGQVWSNGCDYDDAMTIQRYTLDG